MSDKTEDDLSEETSGSEDTTDQAPDEHIQDTDALAEESSSSDEAGDPDDPESEASSDTSDPDEDDSAGEKAEQDPLSEETQAEAESRAEAERRQSGRKGVKLSRLISSKIIDGESQRECYLHLVDISEGGLRINSDDPFPEERVFTLEIGLAPFGTELATRSPRKAFPVKTVWTKSLVGGMVVSGLAFHELDDSGTEIVKAIMEGASPQGRRMHFRLNRVLGVELGKEDEEDQKWLYPLTLDLSVEGMRICLSEALQVGSTFPIKVFLEFELPTVQAQAEVMWQETMPSGRVQVGLKFEGMSERDAMAVKTYIDQCLQQDEAHRKL